MSLLRCCPAKLALAPSSPTADERTATGPPSAERDSLARAQRRCRFPRAAVDELDREREARRHRAKPAR
ncbi:MAG: hypothetical protein M5U28_53675, partial [Sandaracinaceae bacterium]|nr:hypothetical protein [Sandaracinaceae bacterium]